MKTIMRAKITVLCFALFFPAIGKNFGQADIGTMPRLSKRWAICALVDGKPFLILGGQAHTSSAWPYMLAAALVGSGGDAR